MKIAIVIPGMLGNFESTYPRFKKYIINELNPDIFYLDIQIKWDQNIVKKKLKMISLKT